MISSRIHGTAKATTTQVVAQFHGRGTTPARAICTDAMIARMNRRIAST